MSIQETAHTVLRGHSGGQPTGDPYGKGSDPGAKAQAQGQSEQVGQGTQRQNQLGNNSNGNNSTSKTSNNNTSNGMIIAITIFKAEAMAEKRDERFAPHGSSRELAPFCHWQMAAREFFCTLLLN